MAAISIIIPVYNTEKFLKQCLDSVINQTFTDIEIICVNDASTDGSLEILKTYEENDHRIKVINNEKNIGLGLTRNRGFEIASGEYIHFFDSDDWLKLDAYEKLYKFLSSYDVDYIEFNFQEYNQKKKKCITKSKEDLPYLTEIFLPKDNINLYDNSECVAKRIFKKDFLIKHNILFTDIRRFEDTPYWIDCIYNSYKILLVNEELFFYRIENAASLMGTRYKVFNYYFEWFYILKKKIYDIDWHDTIRIVLINKIVGVILKEYEFFVVKDCISAYKYWSHIKNFVLNEELMQSYDIYEYWQLKINEIKNNNYYIYIIRIMLKKYFPNIFRLMLYIKKLPQSLRE